jgi:hypothetical protein
MQRSRVGLGRFSDTKPRSLPQRINWFPPGPLRDTDRCVYSNFSEWLAGAVRRHIAAAVHVGGSAGVQSVTRDQNERYYDLVKNFAAKTGRRF